MMWGCGFPTCCPCWGSGWGSGSGYGSDGFNSSWIWAIIIVVFIIFFFCGSDRGRSDCR